jgi:hypothetical protein
MKRKVLISFLAILLILVLTGCGTIPPIDTAEEMAGGAVSHYWQAIINRQYKLAKYYCITDGVWYNKVDEWEEYININSQGEASLIIYEPYFYKPTEVIGDTAIAYIWIFVDKIPFLGSSVIYGDTFEYEVELIKQDYPPGEFMLK